MGATAFQRRRRELAKLEANEQVEVKVPEQDENAENEQNISDNEQEKPLSPDDVELMEVEKIKALLDTMGIKYSHNTGEAKLKEKLKDAIG